MTHPFVTPVDRLAAAAVEAAAQAADTDPALDADEAIDTVAGDAHDRDLARWYLSGAHRRWTP